MANRQQLIAECKKLSDNGADFEGLIAYLRSAGCWKIDSIAILRETLGISLSDAKQLVHRSSTWRDLRGQDDALHDEIIDALASMPDVTGKAQKED
jgi:uncharacterized protein YPO0396